MALKLKSIEVRGVNFRRGYNISQVADNLDIGLAGTPRIRINGTGIGFFNTTPVAQAAAYTQTFSTADRTHAADGSADFPAGGIGAAAGGWDTAANRDLAITRFNALRVTVDDLKQLVNSVIDDLQALGLVG